MKTVSPSEAADTFAAIFSNPKVKRALEFLKSDEGRTLEEQKAIAVIPSPPFGEQERARDFVKRLAAAGAKGASIDREGNVIVIRQGTENAPKLVVSAHLDTVFPEGTEIKVKEDNGRLYAPGIADDTRGLAEILTMIRALNANGLKTVGDIYFVGTVGEEGLGNLRGVKALFRDRQNLDGFISIDGPETGRIGHVAVGSRRYRVTFKGPGGHSFNDFGEPSAIHAMGRAIAKISDVQTPKEPKTTFTVGTARGGTSVNAIAGEAVMEVDIRAVENSSLPNIEGQILSGIEEAVKEERARWGRDTVRVDVKLVGDRPAGVQSRDAPIIQAALLATRAIGLQPIFEEAGSTDSNLPISLGIPAVTLARGGASGNTHSLGEWFDPTDAYLGPQRDLLTILALVGIDGVTKPLLSTRIAEG